MPRCLKDLSIDWWISTLLLALDSIGSRRGEIEYLHQYSTHLYLCNVGCSGGKSGVGKRLNTWRVEN